MNEENNDEYVTDPIFFQINPVNLETIKEFFMRSKFYDTIGINRDSIEIQTEKINDDYYLIFKKKRENMNNNISKTISVYYWMKGRLFTANNLKTILEAKINRINFNYDRINKNVSEFLLDEEQNFKKTKNPIKLKKDFL